MAGNPLDVGQCKIPPESTKPLLVEQSRGNGFTLRTPVHTFVLSKSHCLEIVTRRKRVQNPTLATLTFEVGFRVQRSSGLKVKLQYSHFSYYFAVNITHEFVTFFVLFTSNTLKASNLSFIANSDEIHTEVTLRGVIPVVYIRLIGRELYSQ
jgi:hypothetical protein